MEERSGISISCGKARRASSLHAWAGFSLVELLVSVCLCGFALTTLYASAGQALLVVRTARETALASQRVQERIELFHAASPFSQITTPASVKTLVTGAAPSGGSLANAIEIYTVETYPAAATFTVTRNGNGGVSSSGAALDSTQKCVKLTTTLRWTGVGNVARVRTVSTILSQGGI